MKFTSLDSICKSVLLRRRYGMHFYLDALLAGRDALRELSLDDLQVVNTKILPIDDFSAVEIPDDYVDYVNVAIPIGQHLQPLVPDNKMTSLPAYDNSMTQVRYDGLNINNDNNGNQSIFYYGSWGLGGWNTSHFNDFGESTGRFFGFGASNWNTFKIIPERNVIQLNEAITNTEFPDGIVVVYISDGRNADAATHIQPYAEATIEAYILWQLKEHRRDIPLIEKETLKREYFRERKVLRARKNPLTIELLRKIVARNTKQSIKS